jgi:hypothetical protein
MSTHLVLAFSADTAYHFGKDEVRIVFLACLGITNNFLLKREEINGLVDTLGSYMIME